MKALRDRLVIPAAVTILVLCAATPNPGLEAQETGTPGVTLAAPVSPGSPAPAYGTATETSLFVGGAAFTACRPDIIVNEDGNGSGVFLGSGTNAQAWAPLNLPDGALITGIDFYYYDWNASLNLNAFVYQFPASGDPYVTLASTASSGSGGWGVSTHNPLSPPTVDNTSNSYVVWVGTASSPTSDLRWRGVRVRYKLQVSPAPGVATFSDVPTNHPFFKFVEALYASGITAGCGGGNLLPRHARHTRPDGCIPVRGPRPSLAELRALFDDPRIPRSTGHGADQTIFRSLL